MKNWIKTIAFVSLLSLTSCFWNSEKENAINAVKQNLEDELFSDSKESFSEKPIFHKRYVRTIIQKSEFEVDSETESDGLTTVVVQVKTIGDFGKYNLKEVLAKQNESRETNFNGGEALELILKMVKSDSEKFIRPTYLVKIDKNSKVLSVKKN